MNRLDVAVALGAIVLSSGAVAQMHQGGNGGFMQRDMTRDQASQRAQSMFQMLDVNHDGVLTRTEADQAMQQMMAGRAGGHGADHGSGRGGGRGQRMMAQLFGSGDSVTLAQFQAQATARFDAEDLNHDGTVTADERAQARAARRQSQ